MEGTYRTLLRLNVKRIDRLNITYSANTTAQETWMLLVFAFNVLPGLIQFGFLLPRMQNNRSLIPSLDKSGHEHISLRILNIPVNAIVNHDATRQKLLTREITHPKTSIAFLYTSAAVLVEIADSDAPITDAQ